MQRLIKQSSPKFRLNQRVEWRQHYWNSSPEDSIESYEETARGIIKEINWVNIRPDGTPIPPSWAYLVRGCKVTSNDKVTYLEEIWVMEEGLSPQISRKFGQLPNPALRCVERPAHQFIFDPALALSEPMRDSITSWYQQFNLTADSRFNSVAITIARRLDVSWQSHQYSNELPAQLKLDFYSNQPLVCELYINNDWLKSMGLFTQVDSNGHPIDAMFSGEAYGREIIKLLRWSPTSAIDTAQTASHLEISIYGEDFSWAKVESDGFAYFGSDDEVAFNFYKRDVYD